MQRFWTWIADPKNQKTLAFLGGGVVAVVGTGWTVYSEFFKKTSPPSPTRTVQNACGVASAGGNVTISGITCSFGVTLAEYEKALAAQEKALRAELAAAADDAKRKLSIQQNLSITQARRKDIETAYKERTSSFAELAGALERDPPSANVKAAFGAAVESGNASTLEEQLRSELESNVKHAANRAYQLGILLRQSGQFAEAYQAFDQAKKLLPKDPEIQKALSATEERLDVFLGPGKVRLSAALSEGGKPVSARFDFYHPEQDLDGNRKHVTHDSGVGKWFTLPPGRYFLRTSAGSAVRDRTLNIVGGKEANLVVDLNAGQLRLSAALSKGRKPVGARFDFYKPEQDLDGNRQHISYDSGIGKWFTLPAGRYLLRTTAGSAVRDQLIDVVGGEVANRIVDLDAGQLRLSAALSKGGQAVGARFDFYKPEQDLDGNRQHITNDSGVGKWFTLPAGRYLLRTTAGSAVRDQSIDVVGGEVANRIIDLNAGQLRLSAVPSKGGQAVGARFDFYNPEQDLDGNRRHIAYDSGIGKWFTLPAGRYFLKTTAGSAKREQFIDVTGGQVSSSVVELE